VISISEGELVGAACSLVWATSATIVRTQSFKVSPGLMNALRCAAAALMFWALLALFGSLRVYSILSLNEWLLLCGSVIIGISMGDTLYLWSIREIGPSRTMALVGVVPLPTLVFEYFLLDQPFPAQFVAGCFLVVAGVGCLSQRGKQTESLTGSLRLGILLSLTATILWGLSTVMIKPAIVNLTPVEANSIRMPLVAAVLFGGYILTRSPSEGAPLTWKTVLIVAGTGLLGMGLGSFLFLKSIAMIGPTKTAVLGALAPVFTMALAAIFLKERITALVVAGVVLCVGGVFLVL
jgi:drug/metabolite transporter (DMT)-like permease